MQAWVEEFAKKEEIKKIRATKLNELSDEAFERFMTKMEKDNDRTWAEKCYRDHYEPHPTHLLYLAFDASETFGEDVVEEWEKDYSFPLCVKKYRGYTFFSMFGQGVHQRVYRGDECIINL